MEKWKKKTLELLSALALEEKRMPAVTPYVPQKKFVSGEERPYFRRLSPSKAGVRASVLLDMLKELEGEPRANVHSIIVVKDGAVICEASAPGYDMHTAHLSHSMSKTVTMLAIGLLSDERRIDLRWHVCDLFPEIGYRDKRFATMTVEDLLTMKSGVSFAEAGTVTEDKWTDAFFDSELKDAPGESFSYNSMNSYILSRIVTKITGKSLTDYLRPRLLDPLSIDNFFWEESAEGISKGGFGVYMSAESWAKIGYLLLNFGMWQGEQIISRGWIVRSLFPHSETPADTGDFDYGYHIWVGRDGSEFLLNGMFGQNVWVCPRNNIVVAMNSGNNELFSQSPALDIVRRHLSEDISGRSTYVQKAALRTAAKSFFSTRTQVIPRERERGFLYLLGVKNSEPFDNRWISALGTYAFPDNNTGILPLLVRVMQNNYSRGIKNFTISKDRDKLFFTSFEGSEKYRFEVGLYSFVNTTVTFGGEQYIVGAMADVAESDDGKPLYRIELRFPELPNTRLITMKIEGSKMYAALSELPNERIAERYMTTLTGGGKTAFLLGLLEKKVGKYYIERKVNALFSPSLVGINTDTAGWEKDIAAESRAAAELRQESDGFIISLISKFISDERDDGEKKREVSEGGFFKKLFSRFRRRDGGETAAVGIVLPEAERATIVEAPQDEVSKDESPEAEQAAEPSTADISASEGDAPEAPAPEAVLPPASDTAQSPEASDAAEGLTAADAGQAPAVTDAGQAHEAADAPILSESADEMADDETGAAGGE